MENTERHTTAAAALALALAAPLCAQAAERPWSVGLHVASVHSAPGFNNSNPGLYVRAPNGFTAGVVRNSYSRTSTYAGWTWETDGRFTAAVTVGAITGYPAAAVMPLVVPSVAMHFGSVAVRLAILPKPPKHASAAALHLMFEFQI